MAIILVLAGLVLATSSYVHNKGARSRAEAEIAAMSAALENYKADNGVYSRAAALRLLECGQIQSDQLTRAASLSLLYKALTGDLNHRSQLPSPENRPTSHFKTNQLSPASTGDVTFIKDPFGNSYGYSTAERTPIQRKVTTPPSIFGALLGLRPVPTSRSGSRIGKSKPNERSS